VRPVSSASMTRQGEGCVDARGGAGRGGGCVDARGGAGRGGGFYINIFEL
jgi:hypothetical protein